MRPEYAEWAKNVEFPVTGGENDGSQSDKLWR